MRDFCAYKSAISIMTDLKKRWVLDLDVRACVNLVNQPMKSKTLVHIDDTTSNLVLAHDCNIALGSLFCHDLQSFCRKMPDTMVTDVGFVGCELHLAHELRHAYQQQKIYSKDNMSIDELNMAKMDAIGNVFLDYYDNLYSIFLSELDANIFAIQYVKDFNDNNDAYFLDKPVNQLLDTDAAIVEYFQRSPFIYGVDQCKTSDQIVDMLEQRKRLFMSVKRSIADDNGVVHMEKLGQEFCDKHCPDLIPYLLRFPLQGLEADDKLFVAAGEIDTTWINQYPALRNELEKMRQYYPCFVKSDRYRGAAFMPNARWYLDASPEMYVRSEAEQQLFDMAEAAESHCDGDDYTLDFA